MKKIKITIIGNSVAMRVRPPQVFPYNENYGQIIERRLSERYPSLIFSVENLSIHRALVRDVLKNIDAFIQSYPQYFIINLGVVDACCREIPLWYSDKINIKKYSVLSHVFLCPLYYNFIKKHRRSFVKLRGHKSWEKLSGFKNKYSKLLNLLIKETNTKIITIAINHPTDRIEKQLPGSTYNILKYNDIIQQLTFKMNQTFLHLDQITPELHCPDGIHYSIEGHTLLAELISNKITDDL